MAIPLFATHNKRFAMLVRKSDKDKNFPKKTFQESLYCTKGCTTHRFTYHPWLHILVHVKSCNVFPKLEIYGLRSMLVIFLLSPKALIKAYSCGDNLVFVGKRNLPRRLLKRHHHGTLDSTLCSYTAGL